MNRLRSIDPAIMAWLGGTSGWFSVENLNRANSIAQLVAALLATVATVCAIILTAPKAWDRVRHWHRKRPPLD